MAYKPGDFFLGVIDFFGTLVPGAVLMYLYGDSILALLGGQPTLDGQVSRWVAFFVGAFVLGQILLGVSELLDWLQIVYSPVSKDRYYQEVKCRIKLPRNSEQGKVPDPPPDSEKARVTAYYRAYSFVRLCSPDGIVEIERQSAKYKLFRSLTLVFLLDFPLAWMSGLLTWQRAAAMSVLFALALWRFLVLLNWTRQLTFEFYALLTDAQVSPKPA